MPDDILIDGSSADAGWLDERALQFGDGLFETVAILDTQPCLWSLHMARLTEGCRRLRLPLPDLNCLAAEARALCAGRARAVLKLYWTAGPSRRGYRRPSPLRPRRMLRVYDWPDAGTARPWLLRRCAHRLSQNSTLAQIKHLNRLDQVIARDEWDDPAIDEGVMLDQEGLVVGGTMSNLFIEQGGKLSTPLIEGAGITGVVRALALRLAEGLGVVLAEGRIRPDQVETADAVYLTNSLIGVARVARYEDRQYDLGLAEHPLMQEVRRQCHQSGPWEGRDE